MPSVSLEKIAAALLLSVTLVGCGPPDEANRAKTGPINGPFIVSEYFTPSGFMGDGAQADPPLLTVAINKSCKQPRPAGAQGDCYHYLYKVGNVKWAGSYWVYPSNSWGTIPGRRVVGPNDLGPNPSGGPELRGYHQVRFYAAIDPLPKAPFLQYFAGGIDGRTATPPQPYWDNGCQFFPGTPPFCTDGNGAANVFYVTDGANLTPDWKQYTLDVSKWSITSLIGAFGFSTNDTNNPGLTQSIYLDDIVWE
jgi:hypothetical protein